MPATASELLDSRSTTTGENGTHEKRYVITGSSSEDDALTALSSAAGSNYVTAFGAVLYRQTIGVRPIHVDTDNEASCIWEGTASFAPPPTGGSGAPTPEPAFSFDTAGGTSHITQSKETIQSERAGGAGPDDFEQAIGVERDDSGSTTINGVDIIVPQYQFRETHWFTNSEINQAYKIAVADATGKLNDDIFRGFAIGEVLFMGASGQRDGIDPDDLWQVTFSFAVQRNRTDVVITPLCTLAEVGGWDYVWCTYATKEDLDAGTTVRRPSCVYRERVYDSADFSTLGIGVGS